MIAFLTGSVAAKLAQKLYLNVGGVGFEVNMSSTSIAALPDVGNSVYVLTYMLVRDDAITLFGFASEKEKALFEKLLSVSGVGPKAALSALSTFSPDALMEAIATQDVAQVSKIPNVGKKTASRIILDLKGSFDMELAQAHGARLNANESAGSEQVPQRAGVREALLSMGFVTSEIDLALAGAPEGAGEQELLHYALKRLGSQ